MIKLSSLLLAAQLKRHTYLKTKIRNKARWSSTSTTLQQHVRLRDVLPRLNSDEIALLSLTPPEDIHIDGLLLQLNPLESVNLVLLRESTSISDARTVFDAFIRKFPDTTNRLSPNAGIIHNPLFESAIVKLQRDSSGALLAEESDCIRKFEIERTILDESVGATDIDEDDLSFAARALNRQRLLNGCSEKKYRDTRYVLSSSNICEKSFSKAGFALSDRRKGVNPMNIEAQLFLHCNRGLWNVSDLNELTLH